jgi:hypothetical protein
MRTVFFLVALFVALAAVACDSGAGLIDAGTDAPSADAGTDAPAADASTD